jgi:hypothetical protein
MATYNELLLSARDVDALAPLVGDRRRNDRFEAEAADALADVLMDAPRVPHDRLPADRVSMNSRVAYREEPGGEARSRAERSRRPRLDDSRARSRARALGG